MLWDTLIFMIMFGNNVLYEFWFMKKKKNFYHDFWDGTELFFFYGDGYGEV